MSVAVVACSCFFSPVFSLVCLSLFFVFSLFFYLSLSCRSALCSFYATRATRARAGGADGWGGKRRYLFFHDLLLVSVVLVLVVLVLVAVLVVLVLVVLVLCCAVLVLMVLVRQCARSSAPLAGDIVRSIAV